MINARGVALIMAAAVAQPLFAETQSVKPIRVGLYNELNCTDPKTREAEWKIISEAPEFSAERITSETIRNGKLDSFDVIVFPGGTANGEARSLGVDGGTSVTKFVRDGHGVVAICAGGYLVVEGWNPETRAIELLNAKSWDDENGHWARGEGFIAVKTIEGDFGTSQTMWFENGPIFVPGSSKEKPAYTPLVRYVTDLAAKDAPKGMMTGHDAVIAAPFGKGRVVAFGPHPELSPDLHHWLLNAIKWASEKDDGSTPTLQTVLERKQTTRQESR